MRVDAAYQDWCVGEICDVEHQGRKVIQKQLLPCKGEPDGPPVCGNLNSVDLYSSAQLDGHVQQEPQVHKDVQQRLPENIC
eukprot:scaffold464079_cov50-Prasinocladus_malaysianus.AAC.1